MENTLIQIDTTNTPKYCDNPELALKHNAVIRSIQNLSVLVDITPCIGGLITIRIYSYIFGQTWCKYLNNKYINSFFIFKFLEERERKNLWRTF
jgi:hypothetical protein